MHDYGEEGGRAQSADAATDAANAATGEGRRYGTVRRAGRSAPVPQCIVCDAPLSLTLIDLGFAPLAGTLLDPEAAAAPETRYPLHARVCEGCWTAQVEPVLTPAELFPPDHPRLSSGVEGRADHIRGLADILLPRIRIAESGAPPLVLEIGSNDGTFLAAMAKSGLAVLGIDPSARAGLSAARIGVPTLTAFFGGALGRRLAQEGRRPALVAALDVLNRVPDPVDVLSGIAALLTGPALFVAEVPYLPALLAEARFDAIQHDCLTYFSLATLEAAARRAGLRLIHAERTGQGGAILRILACGTNAEACDMPASPALAALREEEAALGLDTRAAYTGFTARAEATRAGLMDFLTQAHDAGRRVAAYGATPGGSTLLAYCAAGPDLVACCADRNPSAHGRLMPGSRLPVISPDGLRDVRPDYLIVLSHDMRDGLAPDLAALRAAGTQFVSIWPEISIQA